MPNGTAGTTNRDLIETMLGYQPGQVSPAVLIQMLRQKQQMAVEEDTARAEGYRSGGKALLEGNQASRQYALAKLVPGNEDLTFAEFMKNPELAAKWMKAGAEIVSKDPSKMPTSLNAWKGSIGSLGESVASTGDRLVGGLRNILSGNRGGISPGASFEGAVPAVEKLSGVQPTSAYKNVFGLGRNMSDVAPQLIDAGSGSADATSALSDVTESGSSGLGKYSGAFGTGAGVLDMARGGATPKNLLGTGGGLATLLGNPAIGAILAGLGSVFGTSGYNRRNPIT